jgi:zinc protease
MKAAIRLTLFAALIAATACAPASPAAIAPLDRSLMPASGAPPEYDFPEVQRLTLSNGLPVWLVERSGLPLVSLQMVLQAGAVAESADRAGLASLTAAMITQGTATRSATQIADEIDFLAASLTAGSGRESAVVSLNTLSRNLPSALEIFADVVMNPAFDEAEWARTRDQRIAEIVRSRDQAGTVASEEFSRRVFGATHPFGRPVQGTVASVEAMTTPALRQFHDTYYRPTNAELIVVGDADRAELIPLLERHFAQWRSTGAPPAATVQLPPPQETTRLYLIDRPGSAQSDIRIGHLGVERAHADYFPILVMNAILGGQFSSRINLNLREDKGYTYGASSTFQTGKFPGPFIAGGAVQTAVTTESLIEFMRELEEVRGSRPVTQEELDFAQLGIIRGEPLSLQTNAQIASRIQQIVLFDLPLDYFDRFNERVAAVTLADVNRVAREYLHPERFAIVVVGDRAAIEDGLRTLSYPVEVVQVEP